MGTKLKFSSAYHPQTDGQSERTIQTLEDLLRSCVLEWKGAWEDHLALAEFAYNNSFHSSIGMAPFEALYGRPCPSPLSWDSPGEKFVVGPEMVQKMNERIAEVRQMMLASQSRQKSLSDRRRKDLEFVVGDKVFLRVSPMKGVYRFGSRGKLRPRFVGPFEIVERIGPVAYRVALPPHLSGVHDVFHVAVLRKYLHDPSHVVDYRDLQIEANLTYEEQPVEILDREVRKLRSKEVALVKVLWKSQKFEEATWEPELAMRDRYPHLFST